jgi:hypothetical protein
MHGELWWNDVNRGNSSFIHQSSLAILPAELSSRKQEEQVKGMMNLALQSIFVHTCE